MGYSIPQLPITASPQSTDLLALSRPATLPGGGQDYSVSLLTLGQFIGGGSGTAFISQTTNFTNLAYNYGYYVSQAGGPSTGANTAAMVSILTAATATTPSGGMVYVPNESYSVSFSGSGFAPAQGTVFYGLGNSGSGISGFPDAFTFSAAGDGTLFNCAGPHGYAGTYFENLSFTATSPTLLSTTAISGNWPNVRIRNCGFQNFPTAYYMSSLGGSFISNTIQMNGASIAGAATTTTNGCTIPNTTTGPGFQVVVQANQTLIMGPGEFDNNSNVAARTGAIALGGVNSNGPVEHTTIQSYHLSDWNWGISYIHSLSSAAPIKTTIVHSVHAQCYSCCVLMMVPKANSGIYGEKYIGCEFVKSRGSTDASPLVYVDATTIGSSVNAIDDIEFTNCTVYGDANTPQANQFGYCLFSCSDFRINGGAASNMGSVGGNSANIGIIGPVATVTITGVNLKSNYPNAHNPTNNSSYGLYIIANALASNSNILVQDCVFDANYASAPVHVTGTATVGSQIFIKNCIGYNDQNTVIQATAANAPTGTAQSASTAGALAGGINYFGPSTIMFTAGGSGVTFTVNGLAQTIPANQACCVYLPNSNDKILFSSAASSAIATGSLLWVGK